MEPKASRLKEARNITGKITDYKYKSNTIYP